MSYNRWRLCIVFTIIIQGFALGQEQPPVDNYYRKHIKYYNPSETPNVFNTLYARYFNKSEKDPNKRSIALIAGVSQYKSSKINNLAPAKKDIDNLFKYLKDNQKFDEIIVLKDKAVNETNLDYFLKNYLPKRFRKYKKTKFLFAYTGHGSQNNKNTRGYLVKHNAYNLLDRANSIPLTVLSAWLDEAISDCFQSLVLINSCYGGHFVNIPIAFGGKDSYSKRSGHHVITAGTANQQVFAKDNSSGSYFFDILLEGLTTGNADVGPNGKDGVITTREIMGYLESKTPYNYQIPKLGGLIPNKENNGYFYFYNGLGVKKYKNKFKKLSTDHYISFGAEEIKDRGAVAFKDNDGDGIDNAVDKCPNEYGVIEKFGCPDNNEKTISKKLLLYKSNKGKFGFVDVNTDKFIINPIYNTANDFIDGLALVSKNGKYGFIDKKGKEVIPLKYNYALPFHNGLSAVTLNRKTGYINKKNEIIVPLVLERGYSFHKGGAIIKKNGKHGFINTKGNIIVPPIYEILDVYNPNSLIRAKKAGKFGFIDAKGNEKIPFVYDDAIHFSLGRARVKKKESFFYINLKGICIKDCPKKI
ncbi:hypothetical protein T190115A13A_170076 [Tenacibaculum sp. 190524A02b]|uniref:Peptidase C14 caspase domain-containing protein n=1 Tax=Tenacibaculum vairaonense TaxID=3137860 RepID=A0ABP1F8H4_9FLAO